MELNKAASRLTSSPLLVILLASAAVVMAIAGCGGDDDEADGSSGAGDGAGATLQVVVDPTYRPLAYKDESGELVGFDVDLARALGEHMNREVVFTELAFDGHIPTIQAGNADTNVDLAVTDDREKEIAFSDPYLDQTNIAVVPTDSDLNPDLSELPDIEVGVVSGTSSDQFLAQEAPEVDPVRYNSAADVFRDLTLGRLDAVVINSLTAGYFVTNVNPGEYRLSDRPITPETQPVAAGLSKDNTKLQDEINTALQEMRQDGSLDEVIEEWFGPQTNGQ